MLGWSNFRIRKAFASFATGCWPSSERQAALPRGACAPKGKMPHDVTKSTNTAQHSCQSPSCDPLAKTHCACATSHYPCPTSGSSPNAPPQLRASRRPSKTYTQHEEHPSNSCCTLIVSVLLQGHFEVWPHQTGTSRWPVHRSALPFVVCGQKNARAASRTKSTTCHWPRPHRAHTLKFQSLTICFMPFVTASVHRKHCMLHVPF